MRRLRLASVGLVTALTASILLARVHPFGDVGLHTSNPALAPIMEHSSVPADVRGILSAKCADCHSALTRPPIYSRFAPAAWLMERDISRARAAMDLSLWDTYSAEEQDAFKVKIMLETRGRMMPPLQYRVIHWNARITDADSDVLSRWARGTSILDPGSASEASIEADASLGKTVFEKRCTGCHAVEQDREGPRLRGVFGRTSGSVPGFTYSPALSKAHIVWNESTLEKWLADPDTFIPGNNMEFHVAKPQERRDLIRFLRDDAGLR